MLKLYFLTAFRSLLRSRGYSLLNVLGLALGITCSILLFLVIQYELSYDTFHSKGDRIYRLSVDAHYADGVFQTTSIHFPATNALRNNNPGFENITQMYSENDGQVTVPGDGNMAPRHFINQGNIAFVEPAFFDVFDFDTGGQDLRSYMLEPNNVVLTNSMAKLFFPDEDEVIGKIIIYNNKLTLKIVAVIPDFPVTTDFPFVMLASYPTLQGFLPFDLSSWTTLMSNHTAFAVLPPNADIDALEQQANTIIKRLMPDQRSATERIKLQPLHDIHFNAAYGNYSQRTISKEVIWSMALIGLLLLVTACINFINLATALAVRRAREIGIRKVMGSNQLQLMLQFLGETLLITLVATLISAILVELALPHLNQLLGLKITFSFLENPQLLLFVVLQVLLVTLFAGLYPAFLLARFQPIAALRSRMSVQEVGGLSLRRSLVVLQFTICQVLIICTLIVNEQMQYLRNKDLGFDKDAVVTVPLPRDKSAKMEALRDEILRDPALLGVTFGSAPPSSEITRLSRFRYGHAENIIPFQANMKSTDEHYLELFDIKLVAGRMFRADGFAEDSILQVLINETMRRKLDLKQPEEAIGKNLYLNGGEQKAIIVGVVEDFHQNSLRDPIDPAIFYSGDSDYFFMMAKVDLRQSEAALAHLEQVWQKAYPETVFHYEFMDETLNRFYRDELRQSTLFKIFSFIAIFIGCLGLYGLIAFMATQRTKEIGIRKVMGASVFQITVLFSKEFVKLVLIAFVLAAPIAWYLMSQWLQDFTYRISIGYIPFLMAGAATLVIALITMSTQAVRAAIANPVLSLKAE
ncbi:ABC transporter permease [Pontibacter lucknowensis]|uniref:Duplicated orphan permease n=1 Tax=Pontibacter lucknowensis TaxID=1077936 RepID=A0A1N6X958_9BACT|nr:ABC transporter permease [Pontibacter lucknowensis]SIQ98843.1 duplicated orphan permease [Pontibacter lucknowensis]